MPDPKYYISEIVKSGNDMRIRLLPDDGSGVELELEPIAILGSTPPVENPPVISIFEVTPLSGDAPLAITARCAVSGEMTGRTLDWGDGSDVLETDDINLHPLTNPHTYAAPGTYTVTFTLLWEGDPVEETAEVVVSAP